MLKEYFIKSNTNLRLSKFIYLADFNYLGFSAPQITHVIVYEVGLYLIVKKNILISATFKAMQAHARLDSDIN